jgi:hypothetical protein
LPKVGQNGTDICLIKIEGNLEKFGKSLGYKMVEVVKSYEMMLV